MQQLQRRYCTNAADQIGKHDVTGVEAAVDDSPILKTGDHYHSAQKAAMREEGIEVSKRVWRGTSLEIFGSKINRKQTVAISGSWRQEIWNLHPH